MAMCLQMIQMPPVAFMQFDPAEVVNPSDLSEALRWNCSKTDALSRLWLSYSRYVFSNADPYMVANEGAEAIIDYVEGMGELGQVSVSRLSEGDYELRLGRASLYLSETEEGDVFLYFYSPLKKSNRREECRLDLTECGSDDAACFIATVFEAYGSIVEYYYNNKVA